MVESGDVAATVHRGHNTLTRVAMLLSNPFRPDPRVLKEAECLGELGHSVTVICWDRAGEFPDHAFPTGGVTVERIQGISSDYGIGPRQLLHLPRFWKAAVRRLDSLKPTIIHCHDFDTLPAGLWWGKLHRIPVIYDAHEHYADLVKPRLKGLLGYVLYLLIKAAEMIGSFLASAIITVDETLAEKFQKVQKSVVIVGHWPRLSLSRQVARVFSHAELNLIYIGRLSSDRGAIFYLNLLRTLKNRGIPARLGLVGIFIPDHEAEIFWQEAQGLGDEIKFLGWIEYEKIGKVLESADVGLTILMPEPRYIAALPVKLFEYMAAGLPVLASDFAPIREIVQPAQCGALVDPVSGVDQAASILESWWQNPEIPKKFGQNSQRAVNEKYNFEFLAEKIDRLYKDLQK